MLSRISPRSTGKAVLLVTALLVLFAVSVVGVAHIWLGKEIDQEMTANARGAMRVLAVTLASSHQGARVDIGADAVTNVVLDSMPSFSEHGIVDRAATMVSGVVTIFETRGPKNHVRVSTTVKKENGDRAIGTDLAADHPAQAAIERGLPYYGGASLFGRDFITVYQPVRNAAGKTIGVLFAGLPVERASALVARMTGVIATAAALVLIILAAIAFFIVARSVRPLSILARTVTAIGDGNLDTEIAYTGRRDEIGDIATALAGFKTSALDNRRLVAEQLEAQVRAAQEKGLAAAREATQLAAANERAASERKAAMHALADEFENAVGKIVSSVSSASTELEASATTLTATANTTQQLAGVVASASEEASANVQSVASATNQMTASVNEISRQVKESSRIADNAVSQARATDERINSLSQAAQRIGDVVKLINAVAEQTNLLALNATIEAARAGEAGKGFAVVAQEVKQLAAQTAKATDEIASQVSGMQSETTLAVGAIKDIGTTIGQISQIASTIAAAVEQQGASTRDIAHNVQQAAQGTSRVAGTIVSVNQGSAETGSASGHVLAAARQLAGESDRLKVEVDRFLATVRAA